MLSIAKLQNLKAIHNGIACRCTSCAVVINRKTTKFESNSQQSIRPSVSHVRCYQSQNYKIWKQFTTQSNSIIEPVELLSIAKLQNLKAIHNFFCHCVLFLWVVINRKTTKFESNSQRRKPQRFRSGSCYQSQNYKKIFYK